MKAAILLLPALLLAMASSLLADEAKPPAAPEPAKEKEEENDKAPKQDPADVYFQAWLLSRDAEASRKKGMNPEAEAKLVRALMIFRGVLHQWPQWKQEMVRGRLLQTEETLKSWGWKEGATV